jgi:hypothetical protein
MQHIMESVLIIMQVEVDPIVYMQDRRVSYQGEFVFSPPTGRQKTIKGGQYEFKLRRNPDSLLMDLCARDLRASPVAVPSQLLSRTQQVWEPSS